MTVVYLSGGILNQGTEIPVNSRETPQIRLTEYYQGVMLDLDAPVAAGIWFHTSFLDTSFTLVELGGETIVDTGYLHKQLAIRRIGEPVNLDVETSFDLSDVQTGDHAYYVRVVQEDGGMSWSSPIFALIE